MAQNDSLKSLRTDGVRKPGFPLRAFEIWKTPTTPFDRKHPACDFGSRPLRTFVFWDATVGPAQAVLGHPRGLFRIGPTGQVIFGLIMIDPQLMGPVG